MRECSARHALASRAAGWISSTSTRIDFDEAERPGKNSRRRMEDLRDGSHLGSASSRHRHTDGHAPARASAASAPASDFDEFVARGAGTHVAR